MIKRLLKHKIIHVAVITMLLPLILLGEEKPNFTNGFKHLSAENGLSQSSVFAIYKDQLNFMWFGTRRGLNRYDGASFKYYVHDTHDPSSISSNLIHAIIGDKNNNLIIQTDNGLNYYDRYDDKFSLIPFHQRIWNFAVDNRREIWGVCDSGLVKFSTANKRFDVVSKEPFMTNLFDIAFNGKELLWITSSRGVICYNLSTLTYKQYPIGETNKSLSGDYFVECLGNGQIWVCADNNLLKYDPATDRFVDAKNDQHLNNVIISSFCHGFGDDLLIGTDGNGLLQLNTVTGQWATFNHVPDNNRSLSGNTVYSLFADNTLGIVWIGQYMAGIDYSPNYSNGFNFLYHKPYNKGIINNNVRCLLIDHAQHIWIGTRQGITMYSPSDGETKNLDESILLRSGLSNPIITKIWQGPNGYVWICAYKGGIILYHPDKHSFVKPEVVYPKFNLPNDVGVFDILLDRHNNLWVATGKGTYLFPQNKSGFKFHEDFAKCIIEDRAGRIFIGTAYNGVISVNTSSLQIVKTTIPSILTTTDSKRINSLMEDSNGNIWIGTGGTGIFRYHPTDDKCIAYATDFGLLDKYVAAMAEDLNHDIWITTYSGLVKFNPNTHSFKNIYFEEGIKGKEFNPNAVIRTNSGLIFAGSTNGLLYFDPAHYIENSFIPKVVFTNFFINNQKVTFHNPKILLDTTIEANRVITLNYNQNTIGIEYTAPDYYFEDNVTFCYKIKELSGDWISLGNRRYLDFFKLDPGKYTITVKAQNSDGFMDRVGSTITIIIKKPLWKSNYAMIVYALLIISAFLMIRKIAKIRLRLKYQIFLEKTEKTKLTEINQTRLRFFSDISHEIGTFLSLISLPIETLIKIEEDPIKKHYIEIINKNLKRLQLLVNRIVNLRKIETGNLKLIAEKDNMVSFVKSVCESFKPLIYEKRISLYYDFPADPVITWFDKEKTEHIMYNLLSNALKFTPSGGEISVSLKKENGTIHGVAQKIMELSVFNSGSEITEGDATKIFDKFFTGKEQSFSFGIGLHLAKQYSEIHKGEIHFVSTPGVGVTFTVKIPYGESYLENHEKAITNARYEFNTIQYIDGEKEIIPSLPESSMTRAEGKNLILYIEKNSDLRNFLIEKLKDKYRFVEANDIEEGILKAKNLQPDLILSDINIGNLENLDFCRRIKNDIDISHIPLVIFTLKENIEEQIEGLKVGADAFVSKPISIDFLTSVINNQIESRKKLKLAFHTSYDLPNPTEFSTLDQRFLKRAYKIIEDNIDNSDLGIPEFIKAMSTSKYMLYSKITSLTGQTPNEFIINYRLKKAVAMLKNRDVKDSDIYMDLGFKDLSYFRKCFKKQFGVTPSQFIRSQLIDMG